MYAIVRSSVVHVLVLAIALCLPLTSCAGGEEEAAQNAERQARLDELAQDQQALQAARQELEGLEARLVDAEAGNLPEGEEVDVTALRTEIEQKDAQITTMAEDLNQGLVEFINADPPVEGEPIDPLVDRAFAMKADEDIALAREYITDGGDYARAISIYDDILSFDPDNTAAQEARAEAEQLRFMDEARFAQVQRDMTQAEVEQLLGPANLRNRREYPDQGVVAWYYPKSEARDAAAVWFRKRDETWVVYRLDFNAIAAEGDAAAGEEPTA